MVSRYFLDRLANSLNQFSNLNLTLVLEISPASAQFRLFHSIGISSNLSCPWCFWKPSLIFINPSELGYAYSCSEQVLFYYICYTWLPSTLVLYLVLLLRSLHLFLHYSKVSTIHTHSLSAVMALFSRILPLLLVSYINLRYTRFFICASSLSSLHLQMFYYSILYSFYHYDSTLLLFYSSFSYIHIDASMYKLTTLSTKCQTQLQGPSSSRTPQPGHCCQSLPKWNGELQKGATSVSYTHLDVYKRQTESNLFMILEIRPYKGSWLETNLSPYWYIICL